MLVNAREPTKQILDASEATTPYIVDALNGGADFIQPVKNLSLAASDLEIHAGDEIQLTLDVMSHQLRMWSPHARGLASLLDPLPWWINTAANHFNNREFHLFYRPPLYRIRTPNGAVVCNVMNLSMPGSCANVAGQPYAVDINLLQYVFMNANR
jgi:hypothetical protein